MPPKVEETQDKKPSSEDLTPPTNNQLDPHIDEPQNEPEPIDPNYVRNLEERIAAQQIQYRTLETLVESVRDKKDDTPPPPRNVEKERASFYQDPIGKLNEQLSARDEKILTQMEKMLAPLKQVATSFRATSEYDRLKAIIKNDPVYGKGLRDPDVENVVDSIMKNSNHEITEDNIKSAVAQTMGVKAMGGLRTNGNRTTSTSSNENNNQRVNPPQVPTTRTRSQVSGNKKDLTEDDRLAMKLAGLKPGNLEHEKEYWELIDGSKMTLNVHKRGEGK